MDQGKLDELKAEHGEIYVLTLDDEDAHQIVVKMPTPAQFDRFQATAADQKMSAKATAQLVRDVIVHPTPKEWADRVAKRPGLPLAVGSAVLKLTGATLEVEAKKA